MSLNQYPPIFNSLLDDISRRGWPIDEMWIWLVSLAVIAKESPNDFDKLCDVNAENKKKFLINLLQKKEVIDKADKFQLLSSNYISTDILVRLVNFVKNITNFNDFADELIDAFQKTASRGSEPSITDQVIVNIIKGIVGDASQLIIYDGAAGFCTLTNQIKAKKLVLEDINAEAVVVGNGILSLKDINHEYTWADSLTSHKKSVNADLVVTQIPWGIRFAPNVLEEIKKSKYIQLKDNMQIPTSASDSLWIQHSLYHLNENGRAIILMPQGWLFHGGYDAQLRSCLLESDLIEAVIGLPSSLLKISRIPTVLLVFNKNKINKNIVRFIDASQLGTNIKRRVELAPDKIQLIAELVNEHSQAHSCYREVSLDEIKKTNYELSISRYFNSPIKLKVNDLKSERDKLELAQNKFNEAQEKIMKLIMENR